MKKVLYAIAALAMTMFVAGCNREMEKVTPNGNTVKATFTIQLPETVATKAINDASHVDELFVRVYDGTGALLAELNQDNVAVDNKTAHVDLYLVKDLDYQISFWAQAADKYTIAADGTITMDPTAMMNDGSYDAFYYHEPTFTVTSAFTKAVELTRPFAQLNVGAPTQDFNAAAAAGIATGATGDKTLKTAYAITVPNKINLLDGAVSGTTTISVDNVKTRPNETLLVGTTEYNYAAMLYILAADEASNMDVTLKLVTTQTTTTTVDRELTREVPNVPLRRNYRTNILGNIFTVGAAFEITVDNNFQTPDNNVDMPVTVASVTEANNAMAENKAENTQSYQVPEVAADDTDFIIPSNTTSETITFNIDSFASGVNEITIKDESATTGQYANNVVISVPEGVDVPNVVVNTPNAHVVLQQGNYSTVLATTSGSTLVVEAGTTIDLLKVKQGNVTIEKNAVVTSIQRDGVSADVITYVNILGGEWTNVDSEKSDLLVPRYPIASISGVFYYSLKEAVAAAQEGDTITLLRDEELSLTDGSELALNKSLTITGDVDDSGEPLYTVFGKSTVTGTNDIFISGSGTVTLSNLKIKSFGNNANTDPAHAPIYVSTSFTGKVNLNNVYVSDFNRGGMFLYGGQFNVVDCYIDCANSRSGSFTKGIEIKGNANGTISDTFICNMERSSATYASAGIEIYGNGSIVVKDCMIVSHDGEHTTTKATYGIAIGIVGQHDPSGGSLQVTGSMFDCENGCLSIEANNYTATLDDCDFNNYIVTWTYATSSIIINSGSYAEEVIADNGTIYIHGGDFVNFAPDGNIIIDGGSFDQDPDDYLADGYGKYAILVGTEFIPPYYVWPTGEDHGDYKEFMSTTGTGAGMTEEE